MNVFSLIAKGFSKIASGIKKVITKVKDTVSDLIKDKEDNTGGDYNPPDGYQPPIEDVNYYIDKYLSGLSDNKKEEFKNEYENYMSDSSRLNVFYNESNLSEFYYAETDVDWNAVENKVNDILNERDNFNQEKLLQDIGDNLFDIIKSMK